MKSLDSRLAAVNAAVQRKKQLEEMSDDPLSASLNEFDRWRAHHPDEWQEIIASLESCKP